MIDKITYIRFSIMNKKSDNERGKKEKKYQTRTEKKRNRKKNISLNREK